MLNMTLKEKRIAIFLRFSIFYLTLIATYRMATGGDGVLLVGKWEGLKFFTVQSNLLCAVTSLISLIYLIKDKPYKKWLVVLNLISTTAVFLTFFTVMVYIGPFMGYNAVFLNANFYMHLVTPLLAIYTFIKYEPKVELRYRVNFLSLIPSVIYGIGYFANLIVSNGYGDKYKDWYMFGKFGLGIGSIVFIIMSGIVIGLSTLCYYLYKKDKQKREQ